MAQVPGRIQAYVVFLKPAATTENWEKTDLWRTASAIPGVNVLTDTAGIETRRFGAETSGQTVVYDTNGRLRFHGGITLARGHAGDNPGRSAIEELVTGVDFHEAKTPVFGCALFETQCQKGDSICKP
jgi:hypothetical protein